MRNDVLGIHHVALTVSNLEQSIDFYKKFGFNIEQRLVYEGSAVEVGTGVPGARLELALLSRPHFRLELIEYLGEVARLAPAPNHVGSAHVCFDVSDIESVHRDLTDGGVETVGVPTHNVEGKNKWVYLRDPDGNIIELLERL